jgi:sugar lactone lactonase YvrE
MRAIWFVAGLSLISSPTWSQDTLVLQYVPQGPIGGGSRCERFDWGGSVVASSPAGTSAHIGLDIDRNGNWVTSRRFPNKIEIYDPSGTSIASFLTPQLAGLASDVSLFADGTIALGDQHSSFVHLYAPDGAYRGVFLAGYTPWMSTVDAQDRLWVIESNLSPPFTIRTLDRSGVHLQSFQVPFRANDLVVAPNGDLWVSDLDYAKVYHLNSTGGMLGSFPTGFSASGWGIGLASDGSIWCSTHWIPELRRFSPTGTLLQTISLATTGARNLRVFRDCGVRGNYCAAGTTTNGCTASLSGIGAPSASGTTPFSLVAQGLDGQKTGLIFYGTSGPNTLPWAQGSSSFLCVKPPTQRTTPHGSGGTIGACDGTLALDWNAYFATHPGVLGQPLQPGADFWAQAWFRDPPAAKATSLSDALAFRMCP